MSGLEAEGQGSADRDGLAGRSQDISKPPNVTTYGEQLSHPPLPHAALQKNKQTNKKKQNTGSEL